MRLLALEREVNRSVAIEDPVDVFRIRMVDGLPIIETGRLILMIAMRDQVGQIVRYLQRNREHLRPWEPARNESYFAYESWLDAPHRDQKEAKSSEAFRFRMLLKPSVRWDDVVASLPDEQARTAHGEFLGTISLRSISPWPGHNATLGYSLDHFWEGHGLMREGVSAVIRFGFENLNLRRIEACYMPANTRSERLLGSLGFQREGLLKSSMEVDGAWEDHNICALINHNWRRT